MLIGSQLLIECIQLVEEHSIYDLNTLQLINTIRIQIFQVRTAEG